MSTFIHYFLFQIFPYLMLTLCVVGCILRYDRDPYSWRSKSSQLLKRKSLIMGSILFHVGILIIIGGHIGGLLTPIEIFKLFEISHAAKQMLAIIVGGIAGLSCLIGLCLLLHRRLTEPRIYATSSRADIAVLCLLFAQVMLGLLTIPQSMQHLDGHEMLKFMHWAQHIATFRADAYQYIIDTALVFKLHISLGLCLLGIVPFTRLVHALSVPLGYLPRPYQMVRKRET